MDKKKLSEWYLSKLTVSETNHDDHLFLICTKIIAKHIPSM